MFRHAGSSNIRKPLVALTVFFVIMGAVLVSLGSFAHDFHRRARVAEEQRLQLEELRASIIHLDEVLTMSARMAVLTRDPEWQKRYRLFQPQLSAAMNDAVALAGKIHGGEASVLSTGATDRLAVMERHAFDLLHRGRQEDARLLLSSDEYARHKRAHVAERDALTNVLTDTAGMVANTNTRLHRLAVGAILLALFVVLIGWLIALLTVRNWKRLLARQEKELAEANALLARKVSDRTKDLVERVKELACLQEVRNEIHANRSMEELCPLIVDHLAQAMQFPDRAFPCITLGDKRYGCDEFTGDPVHGFHADIESNGTIFGRLSVFYTQERSFPVPYEQDLVDAVAKILAHYIERKRAENAAAATNERMRLAADAAGFGIWDLDLATDCLEWDDWMYRLYGISPEDFSGEYSAWQKWVHPDDCDRASTEVEQALLGKKDFNTDFRIIRPDGEVRYLRACATVISDANGKPLRMTGINYDVTSRKIAERKLRDSEEKYRRLFEHALSGVALHEIVLDETGNPVDYVFLSANPAFETQTGLRVTDIIGRRATEVLPGIEATPFLDIYGKVVLTGVPVSCEQYAAPLGRHYSISAYPVSKSQFGVIFTDISDRKRAEETLTLQKEMLAREQTTLQTIFNASQVGLFAGGRKHAGRSRQ